MDSALINSSGNQKQPVSFVSLVSKNIDARIQPAWTNFFFPNILQYFKNAWDVGKTT